MIARVLQEALDHAGNTHTLADVAALIERGDAMLWTSPNSVAVTEVYDFPRAKVFHTWLAGGDKLELWNDLLPQGEAWARSLGCQRMTITGRPGWEREMAPLGFAPMARTIAKELK